MKEHEELGRLVAEQYLLPHAKSQHYKAAVKAVLRSLLGAMGMQELKDVEACVAGVCGRAGFGGGSEVVRWGEAAGSMRQL